MALKSFLAFLFFFFGTFGILFWKKCFYVIICPWRAGLGRVSCRLLAENNHRRLISSKVTRVTNLIATYQILEMPRVFSVHYSIIYYFQWVYIIVFVRVSQVGGYICIYRGQCWYVNKTATNRPAGRIGITTLLHTSANAVEAS